LASSPIRKDHNPKLSQNHLSKAVEMASARDLTALPGFDSSKAVAHGTVNHVDTDPAHSPKKQSVSDLFTIVSAGFLRRLGRLVLLSVRRRFNLLRIGWGISGLSLLLLFVVLSGFW
jgi:hypothetical protein